MIVNDFANTFYFIKNYILIHWNLFPVMQQMISHHCRRESDIPLSETPMALVYWRIWIFGLGELNLSAEHATSQVIE